jgi:exosortase
MAVPFLVCSLVLFWGPLSAMSRLSLSDERYSALVLIPFVTAALLYIERKKVFAGVQYSPRLGIPMLVAAAAFYLIVKEGTPPWLTENRLSFLMLGVVLTWTAGFFLYFGAAVTKAAAFPFCFLLLIVPLPASFMDGMAVALQHGSAEVSSGLFRMIGVPVLRQGVTFLLPGLAIEIAEQCSGIRSSVALFIATALAGHLFLRSGWRMAILTFSTIPLVILKNAIRIVTIASLAVYVNHGFLYGRLHRYGGLPFSLIDLAILVPFLLVLQKSEAPVATVGPAEVRGLKTP